MKGFDDGEDGKEPTLPAPLKVAQTLKAQIDEFQTKIPMISCLCNKGLRDRHWEDISKILGYPFKPTEATKLSNMLTMGLESKLEQIDEIASAASKEYSLEKVGKSTMESLLTPGSSTLDALSSLLARHTSLLITATLLYACLTLCIPPPSGAGQDVCRVAAARVRDQGVQRHWHVHRRRR